jgi:hypothetical protein
VKRERPCASDVHGMRETCTIQCACTSMGAGPAKRDISKTGGGHAAEHWFRGFLPLMSGLPAANQVGLVTAPGALAFGVAMCSGPGFDDDRFLQHQAQTR